jgi:hypothetical protein
MSGWYFLPVLAAALLALVACGLAGLQMRRGGLDRWIVTSVGERSKHHALRAGEPVHLVRCIADHFEPGNGGVT